MKIEKNKLVKVVWKSEEFGQSLCINNIDGLILNSITVFGKIPNGNYQEVPFFIKYIKGKATICPQIYGTKFRVFGERVVKVNAIEIKSEDYIKCYPKTDGSYKFIFNEEVEIK